MHDQLSEVRRKMKKYRDVYDPLGVGTQKEGKAIATLDYKQDAEQNTTTSNENTTPCAEVRLSHSSRGSTQLRNSRSKIADLSPYYYIQSLALGTAPPFPEPHTSCDHIVLTMLSVPKAGSAADWAAASRRPLSVHSSSHATRFFVEPSSS